MIINRELRDWYDSNGQPCKELIVSYVATDGTIKYLRYAIPASEMFEWEYSHSTPYNDPIVKSFDNKPVRRAKVTNGRLSDDRLYQILYDLNANGQLDEIFKLNYPNTYFWDIEVEVDDSGFPDAESARMPITVMSWVHYPYCTVFGTKDLTTAEIEKTQEDIKNHCKTFNGSPEYIFEYKSYRSEVEMLYDFITNYLSKAPCITGWNIFGYDYPYLYNRCKLLNIDLEVICPTKKWVNQKNADGEILKLPMHRLFYDYMLAYKTWDRTVQVKESNKLDFVGMATCGVQKVQHKLSLKDMWIQQPREYIFYNAIDSILVEQIDRKIKTSKSMFGLANLIKGNVLEAFSTIAGLHIVQNEYLWKEKKVVPKTMDRQSHRDYEGAYVFPPTPGVFKWVLGLDFASLYPTTQRQFNISPDTYLFTDKNYIPKSNEIKTASGAVFTKDFEGFLPKILTDFYAQRKMHKKYMKNAYQKANELENILKERLKNEKSN